MRRTTCLITAIIILFANLQTAFAVTYYDECNSLITTEEVATYQGFITGVDDVALQKIFSPIDNTYFKLEATNGTGIATYKMRGVEKIRVKIYTKSSLYAVNNNGDYVLGYKTFLNSPPNSAKHFVYINPNTKEIFTEIMNAWYQFDTKTNKFLPIGAGATKPENLINFGVQGLYSDEVNDKELTTIKSYRKIDNEIRTQIPGMRPTPYFYETYEFDVPKTAEKIGFVIYDGGINFEGPIYVNNIRFARVEFEGNKIELGEKEEILPPPPPQPPSSSSSTPTGGGGGTIKPPSPSKSSSSKSSSIKSSSSKSSSSKSISSKSSSSKSSSLKSSTSMVSEVGKEVLGDDEIGKEESTVYLKIEGAEAPKTKTDTKSIAVTAIYSIIVLTGVVTFVLKVR